MADVTVVALSYQSNADLMPAVKTVSAIQPYCARIVILINNTAAERLSGLSELQPNCVTTMHCCRGCYRHRTIPAGDRGKDGSCRQLPGNYAQLPAKSACVRAANAATQRSSRQPSATKGRPERDGAGRPSVAGNFQATARIAATDMQCPARCRRTRPRASKSRIHFETVPLWTFQRSARSSCDGTTPRNLTTSASACALVVLATTTVARAAGGNSDTAQPSPLLPGRKP